jgi:PD-(D/E)XK endonuclease
MAPLKTKGDLAELKVACDLVERGYRVAIPFGEDCDFDLVAWKPGESLRRVQVKYSTAKNGSISVRCCSHSLTNGKVKRTKSYTPETIDILAVYELTAHRCYYVPASELRGGRRQLILRVDPARNNQRVGIRFAEAYLEPEPTFIQGEMEPAGLEPAPSSVQAKRSPN